MLDKKSRQIVLAVHGNKCKKCGRTDHVQIHHVRARVDGGTDELSNLCPLCVVCHEEWHACETATVVSFDQWLELPPYAVLLAVWRAINAIDNDTCRSLLAGAHLSIEMRLGCGE